METNNLYLDMNQDSKTSQIKRESYIDFLKDFRTYVIEYVNATRPPLKIYELQVEAVPLTLFKDQDHTIRVVIRNEGDHLVYLSTDKKMKYPLHPGDREELHINRSLTFFCPEGSSTLSFIEN